ncbi:Transglutaminase-like superfamily protein [Paenibacillus algorifonticola]|uniref:Transglutaminase-like superfamily protein n=1 Tax=Paenibacillus algorifonticola TaxID=684063 RepID=A0A1I2FNK3_9BACL|nr:transglutaminase domain-containing protein [Paenibacillus algorifonticola]SFF06011.1 Transglutaminase-like superfamily protein [Paenibacillus algorifonticola]
MKKMLLSLLVMCLLLTGCMSDAANGFNASIKLLKYAWQTPEKLSVQHLKQKYGEDRSKQIMPLYNVAKDMKFEFNFQSDLSQIDILKWEEMITVHTDRQALPSSQMASFNRVAAAPDSKSIVTVEPLDSGVLPLPSASSNDQLSWGNAPIYYLRINYDMASATPQKLEKPFIIPFTVESKLPVPNLSYEISEDGRLKLVWDKITGISEYKVYQTFPEARVKDGTTSAAGKKSAFYLENPVLIERVKGTALVDFGDTAYDQLELDSGESFTLAQNTGVQGNFYVTAVANGKESNFSAPVVTADLSSQLPTEVSDEYEGDLFGNTYEYVDDLPYSVEVKHTDGSISFKDIMYETEQLVLEPSSPLRIPYSIKGTALTGVVWVEDVTLEDIDYVASWYEDEDGESEGTANTGYVQPENTTYFIPDANVPTIITRFTKATSATDNLIDQQIENTRRVVAKGDKATVPTDKLMEKLHISADSALEEYLARSLMTGEEDISLMSFPEAQNTEVLIDVVEKVMYQNPYIIGLASYGYDYRTLTLYVSYENPVKEMRAKQREIMLEAQRIVAATITPEMSDEEKRLAIYDYLNDTTVYDDDALDNAYKYDFRKVDPAFYDAYSTYGIMINKLGVCMSYAYTYKLLNDLAGVETIVVTGYLDGVPHAWNKVKIGGEWLNVDPTNNATNSDVPYLLYNANDATAINEEYVEDVSYWLDDELNQYTGDSNKYDYYVKNGLEVTSNKQFRIEMKKLVQSGQDQIILRLSPEVDYSEMLDDTWDIVWEEARDQYDDAEMYYMGSYVLLEL